MAQLARRHHVLVLQVLDPRQFDSPSVGPVLVEDAETGGGRVHSAAQDGGLQQRVRDDLTRRVTRPGREVAQIAELRGGDLLLTIGRLGAGPPSRADLPLTWTPSSCAVPASRPGSEHRLPTATTAMAPLPRQSTAVAHPHQLQATLPRS